MESGIFFFTAQWFTIQPDLFGRIEDEVGELGESEKEFVRICTTALNSGRFAKYRWCGNGHPPSSRVAIFKMLVLKALRNFPTTKDTLLIVRQSPVLRTPCSQSLRDAFGGGYASADGSRSPTSRSRRSSRRRTCTTRRR